MPPFSLRSLRGQKHEISLFIYSLIGKLSVRGIVCRGNVRSGNCLSGNGPSGNCLSGNGPSGNCLSGNGPYGNCLSAVNLFDQDCKTEPKK